MLIICFLNVLTVVKEESEDKKGTKTRYGCVFEVASANPGCHNSPTYLNPINPSPQTTVHPHLSSYVNNTLPPY